MKNLLHKILFLLFAVTFPMVAQERTDAPKDWIKEFDGIPIKTSVDWNWWARVQHRDDVKKMADSGGVDVIHLDIYPDTYTGQMDTLNNFELQAIPMHSRGYNWIQHYTDAKYTVWEAEGNPNYDVNLEYKSGLMNQVNSGGITYLKLNSDSAYKANTLIWGPYYKQDLRYYASQDDSRDTVRYTAEFNLKLERNLQYDTAAIEPYNPNTTLCVIQVTQTYVTSTAGGVWQLGCTYPIAERTITRGEFVLNQFDNFRLDPDNEYDYRLTNDSCQSNQPPPTILQYHSIGPFKMTGLAEGLRAERHYIEFKVKWLGNPNYLISVDKVTVSDLRGKQLKGIIPSNALANIDSQANSLNSYTANVTGWLGIDEPNSIDIFEPIRIVDSILYANSQGTRPLWIPFMGRWDGAWNNRADPFGAMGKSPWVEFKKRVGSGNIVQNAYMFDSPCTDSSTEGICQGDWKSENIWRTAELMYKQAYELDPYFGVSIQCGAVKNTQAHERNVARHEVLYSANLALMYGAKFLDLYPYFAQRAVWDSASGYTYHGIVDWGNTFDDPFVYTDKYSMLRDTLSPRLKGLFGKTIKGLNPVKHFLGINANVLAESTSPLEFIDHIYALGNPNDICIVDLGIFSSQQDASAKYFMPLNRYYSNLQTLIFGIRYLSEYKNWDVTKYIDTTHFTLVSTDGTAELTDQILPGDANLYSILPVVKYGGSLVYDDTIQTGTVELTDNMTIENGVDLVIQSEYIAKDTITLEGTGFITGTGYFHLQGNGEIITNTWSRSLFRSRNGNHPKILWGKYPGGTILGYNVYRRVLSGNWSLIAQLNASARSFIDSTFTLPTQQYLWKVDYRVGVVSEYFTNTITYEVNNPFIAKEGNKQEEVFTYNLSENYPNPFNPSTMIKYSLADAVDVSLVVYDILGREVRILVDEKKVAGNYETTFDAGNLPSGVYIYRMITKNFTKSQKMVLVK